MSSFRKHIAGNTVIANYTSSHQHTYKLECELRFHMLKKLIAIYWFNWSHGTCERVSISINQHLLQASMNGNIINWWVSVFGWIEIYCLNEPFGVFDVHNKCFCRWWFFYSNNDLGHCNMLHAFKIQKSIHWILVVENESKYCNNVNK